ncbi:uncharacterized protein [Bemisia tabaci]|uniref:uncharacterized protein n=1 Tax=Bemisia tabaci TaxID=7038 RepID=UPI003B27B634
MDGRQKRSFIKEVKKYPVLWRTSPAAPPKQRALKWQKVADRFGMTSEEVQGEWKRLQQARRAAQWRRSYTPQEKLWKYEEDMSFLGDISIRKNSQPIVPLVRLNIEGTGAVTSGENSASTSTSTSGDTSAAVPPVPPVPAATPVPPVPAATPMLVAVLVALS